MHQRTGVTGVLFLLVTTGCAGIVQSPHEVSSLRDPALADFYARVEKYVAVREELRTQIPALRQQQPSGDPTLNQELRRVLADRIQEERKAARQGDIFTKAIAVTVRERLNPQVRGSEAATTRAAIRDDAPARFALHVNDSYPEGASLPTMPTNVLAVLPALPPGLEYRIVDVHLILRDTEANIIVDYLFNVM